jgi:hypothetical protein
MNPLLSPCEHLPLHALGHHYYGVMFQVDTLLIRRKIGLALERSMNEVTCSFQCVGSSEGVLVYYRLDTNGDSKKKSRLLQKHSR